MVRAEAPQPARPASTPDALRLRVIDGLSVEGIAEHDLGSRKARLALRVLGIAQGRPVTIERLSDVIWPDDPPGDPPAQVAVIMSRLRRVLGASRISHGDAGYALHADWVDLSAAAELVAEAERRLREDEPRPRWRQRRRLACCSLIPRSTPTCGPWRTAMLWSGSAHAPGTSSRVPRSLPETWAPASKLRSRRSTRTHTTRSRCGC